MNALIQAMDGAYRVAETRPAWKRCALAIGLTLLAGATLVSAFVLLVVGEVFGLRIAQALGIAELYRAVLAPGRWAAIALALLLAMAVLYRTAPNVDPPWRWVLPGAALFTAGWSLATYAFSLYVANFGAYSATYGTLGGAAVLLIWFYVSSLLLLLGAELNAYVVERTEPAQMAAQRGQRDREQRAQQAEWEGAQRTHCDTARKNSTRDPSS
jgi:membrane protein